jgi:hypothetical protein
MAKPIIFTVDDEEQVRKSQGLPDYQGEFRRRGAGNTATSEATQ